LGTSVTNHIQKLEELYGGNILLERRGKYMKPTSSGELLYDYAKRILSLYQESHLVLEEQEIKTLSIGTIETLAIYYLPPLLDQFRRMYPNINIRIVPGSEKNIIHMVKEKEIDFGLIWIFHVKLRELKAFTLENKK
jgi:DNA-binding transcriptional LysR family regulator